MDTKNPVVQMDTSLGGITLELDAEKAPISVANFLEYAAANTYNGTIFHRVIPGFMVQGGGYDVAMRQKPTRAAIKNEAGNGLKNKRGTIAMARTSDVDSATCQFFVNVTDNDFLDHTGESPDKFGYCVFGHVTAGMEVVDAMTRVPTRPMGGHEAVPQKPIVIVKVKAV